MKVLVYGTDEAPDVIQRLQSYRAQTPEELLSVVKAFSGGEFWIVILDFVHKDVALAAKRQVDEGDPLPMVVLALNNGQLFMVLDDGNLEALYLPS